MADGKTILARATSDPKILRQLSRRLVMHASTHMMCGYSEKQGVVPDTAAAALMLEALADLLEETSADD